MSRRVYYSTWGRQKVSQARQRGVIQIRVRQVQDGRWDQGQDRQKGQNWENKEKQKLDHRKQGNMLVGLDETNWQQANRKRRYKYTG
jgi:hypothetical protein